MKENTLTLFLELEKAKKEYRKSLRSLVSVVLVALLFITTALPTFTKAAFTDSLYLNGPVLNGQPTLVLDAYGIEFSDDVLEDSSDASLWETEPSDGNQIKVFVQPDYSALDLANLKDEDFLKSGRIRYNLYFSDGEQQSEVYTDQEVYVYFSPGSVYTLYDNLVKEFRLKYQQIKNDDDFYDYYLSSISFLELYLREALPQNNAYAWKDSTNGGQFGDNPGYQEINNLLNVPENNFYSSLKERNTPFHRANSEEGLYLAPYYPIQYNRMPNYESVYRVNETAYIPKGYYMTDYSQKKDISVSELEKFYATTLNIPGLYNETFKLFYNPEQRMINSPDVFYTMQRLSVDSSYLNAVAAGKYLTMNGMMVDGEFFSLPTFTNNFYLNKEKISPLNIEYSTLYRENSLFALDVELTPTENSQMEYRNILVPALDGYYNYNQEFIPAETNKVYGLENNFTRGHEIENDSSIQTVGTQRGYIVEDVEKIQSNIIPITVPAPKEHHIDNDLSPDEAKAAVQKYLDDGTLVDNMVSPLTKADKLEDFLNWLLDEGGPNECLYQYYAWDATSTVAFNTIIDRPGMYDKITGGIKRINTDSDSADDMNDEDSARLAFMALWPEERGSELARYIAYKYYSGAGTRNDIDNISSSLLPPSVKGAAQWAKDNNFSMQTVLEEGNQDDIGRVLMSVINDDNVDNGIECGLYSAEGVYDGASAGDDTGILGGIGGFFKNLRDSLIEAIKWVIDVIFGNIFKFASEGILWLGYNIFRISALGSASVTTASGGFGYVENTMNAATVDGTSSSMANAYSVLQNLAILMLVLVVIWYGFGAVIGDMANGLVAQVELKDMFPRLFIAIFMIGGSINGDVFSGTFIVVDALLWVVDSLTIAVLSADSFGDINALFNFAGKLGNDWSPDAVGAMLLFILSIIMFFFLMAGALLFLTRMLLIWILILFAPIAWFFYIHRSTEGITKTWLRMLTQTISIQFFWIMLLIIFGLIFSMPTETIWGFNIDDIDANSIPASAIQGEDIGSGSAPEPAPKSYQNNIDISPQEINYMNRGYLNQDDIYYTTTGIDYVQNSSNEAELLPIWNWSPIDLNLAVVGSDSIQSQILQGITDYVPGGPTFAASMVTMLGIVYSGLIAIIFFFLMLKLTSQFANSALANGVGTMQGVGQQLKQQFNQSNPARKMVEGGTRRLLNPKEALKDPSRVAGQARRAGLVGAGAAGAAIAKGKELRNKGLKGSAAAATEALKDKTTRAALGAREAVKKEASIWNKAFGRGDKKPLAEKKAELRKEMDEFIRTGKLKGDDKLEARAAMAKLGLKGNTEELSKTQRHDVANEMLKQRVKRGKDADFELAVIKRFGDTLGNIESKVSDMEKSGDPAQCERAANIRQSLQSFRAQHEQQYTEAGIKQYNEIVKKDPSARNYNMERHIALEHVRGDLKISQQELVSESAATLKSYAQNPERITQIREVAANNELKQQYQHAHELERKHGELVQARDHAKDVSSHVAAQKELERVEAAMAQVDGTTVNKYKNAVNEYNRIKSAARDIGITPEEIVEARGFANQRIQEAQNATLASAALQTDNTLGTRRQIKQRIVEDAMDAYKEALPQELPDSEKQQIAEKEILSHKEQLVEFYSRQSSYEGFFPKYDDKYLPPDDEPTPPSGGGTELPSNANQPLPTTAAELSTSATQGGTADAVSTGEGITDDSEDISSPPLFEENTVDYLDEEPPYAPGERSDGL